MGDNDDTADQPDAWEGMPDPPPAAPGGHGLGPEHDMVALLSRISESTRMTRVYVGWMLAIQLIGIAVAVVLVLSADSGPGSDNYFG